MPSKKLLKRTPSTPQPQSKKVFNNLVYAYRGFLQLPEIAKALGPDHIELTPLRVVKALSELVSGYKENPAEILKRSFKAKNYNQMICIDNIGFHSLCAHHLLPFMGKVHFAYIPNHTIVGLSKIPRIIEVLSRRLQVQENLAEEIVDVFQDTVNPKGCAVVIDGRHMCMEIRGVRKEGANTRTTALRGIFLKDSSAKLEFLSSINKYSK